MCAFVASVGSHIRYSLCAAEGNVQKSLCRVAEKAGFIEKRLMKFFWDSPEIQRIIAVECDWSWEYGTSWQQLANYIIQVRASVQSARVRFGQTEQQVRKEFLEAVDKALSWHFSTIQAQAAIYMSQS